MKLGVGVIIFSGAEFLKPMLKCLRNYAYYIVGVYSMKSYTGSDIAPYVLPLLEELKEEELLDETMNFSFDMTNIAVRCQELEREKRGYAQNRCVEVGCTHFLVCDIDEFYFPNQFRYAMKKAEKEEMTICKLYDYVHSPLYRGKTTSILHIPFIHRIGAEYYADEKDYPVLMDLSRVTKSKSHYVFSENEIVMHHMTAVRYNMKEMKRKFEGHAHYVRLGQKRADEYIDWVCNFNIADNKNEYIKVNDNFGILEYWRKEFKDFYERYNNA